MSGAVLGQFLSGARSIKDMGGPIRIAKTSGEAATVGFEQLIYFAAFISINLGFINLLPLPMLDGGHLAFYAYEAVRRRPASMQVQEWAFRFGFVAIVLLMRSEEHTSELQSLMRISYAVFCLQNKNKK